MTSAAVGFQCPECVHGGPGRPVVVRPEGRPLVMPAVVVGVLIAAYAVQVFGSHSLDSGRAVERFAVARGPVVAGQWWRILTSGFIHLGLLHLGLNAFFFWVLVGPLERAAGRVGAIGVLLCGLVGGSLGVIVADSAAAGASGAAYAVMGALAIHQLVNGVNIWESGLGRLIGLNLVFSVVLASSVSLAGHLGGLGGGALAGCVLFLAPRARLRGGARAAIVLALGVFLIGVTTLVANVLVGYTN